MDFKESKKFFQGIINSINDPLFVKDDKGRFIMLNNASYAMVEFTPEEMIGKTDHDLFPKELADAYLKIDKKVLKTGVVNVNEERITGKHGDEFVISTKKSRMITPDGKKYLVGTIRDITKQKKHEEQLEATTKRAEDSERLKSEFLANMSHEIRTPINAILGFADLIHTQYVSQEYLDQVEALPAKPKKFFLHMLKGHKENLGMLQESGHLLITLITDILDLAKIETGKLDIEQLPCSLSNILKNTRSNIEIMLKDKPTSKNPIEVRSSLPRNINDAILTDPTRLQQVLNNLVNNAVKFTSKGFIEFGVSLKKKEKMLEFYVRDTGIGIPKKMQDVVFETFRQADSSITRKFGGSGLGLSITRQLVKLMGGTIELRSEVRKGTTFYFSIPYVTSRKKEPKSMLGRAITRDPHTHTVLVAEDNKINRTLMQKILRERGYTVVEAENGVDAISRFKTNNEIELILMDAQMPMLDGLNATKKIRQIEKDTGSKPIPIIALTANAVKGYRDTCLQAGCNDYIVKPVKIRELFNLLDRHWKK